MDRASSAGNSSIWARTRTSSADTASSNAITEGSVISARNGDTLPLASGEQADWA